MSNADQRPDDRFLPPSPARLAEAWRVESIKPHEWAAIVTFLVFSETVAYNAGIFSRIPSQFVEIFSTTEVLIGGFSALTSLTIVLFGAYVAIVYARGAWNRIYRFIDSRDDSSSRIKNYFLRPIMVGAVILFFLALSWASRIWGSDSGPWFQLVAFCAACLVAASSYVHVALAYRSVHPVYVGLIVYAASLLVAYCCGDIVIDHKLRHEQPAQSFMLKSVGCLDRKLIRGSSGGFLLYNWRMRTFEFRERSDVVAIFPRAGCV
jgi:hypothetical protein